jgi:hypothetical protein
VDKIFGGPIVPTLAKLVLLSFIVGLGFALFGIDPIDLWRDLGGTVRQAWAMVLDAIDWGAKYAILGAIVVLPIWILYRVLRAVTGPKA